MLSGKLRDGAVRLQISAMRLDLAKRVLKVISMMSSDIIRRDPSKRLKWSGAAWLVGVAGCCRSARVDDRDQ